MSQVISAQTRTRSPRDTRDRIQRAAPRSDRDTPRIEGRLNLISTQLQMQRKFFWCEFWSRHQLPCLDPADEALFGCLMVAPSLERSLVNHSTLEKSWRLTARRLLGWIRVRHTKSSSSYWLELELDECRDLDDELTVTPIYVFETTNLLRDMYGLRFGKLLADLLFDRKSFAVGALYDAVWKSTSDLGCEPPRRRADAAAGTSSHRWRGIATPSSRRGHGANGTSMAWNRHAIAQTPEL